MQPLVQGLERRGLAGSPTTEHTDHQRAVCFLVGSVDPRDHPVDELGERFLFRDIGTGHDRAFFANHDVISSMVKRP